MRNRENIQTDVLLAGDAPAQLPSGLTVRPISFATMLIFQRLRHPFAGVQPGSELELTQEHLAQALWVMCAPWEQVRQTVCSADPNAVAAAVLDFAATVSPVQMVEFTRYMAGEKEGIDAVGAVVVPDADSRRDSKN